MRVSSVPPVRGRCLRTGCWEPVGEAIETSLVPLLLLQHSAARAQAWVEEDFTGNRRVLRQNRHLGSPR